MRALDDIRTDIESAMDVEDGGELFRLADELDNIGSLDADALAHNTRGAACRYRGDYRMALDHFQRAKPMFEELGNRRSVAGAALNIGNVYVNTNEKALALEHFQYALSLYEELDNRSGAAAVIGGIGVVYLGIGDYSSALEHFHRAFAIDEELGNHSGVATVANNIGLVYSNAGDYPAALEYFHIALAKTEVLGNHRGAATATANIGIVYENTGDYTAALEHHHRALEQLEVLGNKLGVATVTGNIGVVYNQTGQVLLGLEYNRRALALHEELGNSSGVASVIGNIITALLALNLDDEARELLERLDGINVDNPSVRVERELHRAVLHERKGENGIAVAILQAAIILARDLHQRADEAKIHGRLRDLAQMSNDLGRYIEHNNEFLRITEEINGKDTATKLAMQVKQREIDAKDREHQKHMAVLHSTLPKHIADRVARGEVVNDHHENASVIFLDIVGFTSISDRIPSGHVVHLLEQIFTTLDAVCGKHNVIKIKTIGDSYMAVSFENVVNASTCALDMMASLDALEIAMPPALGDTSWTKDVGDIKVRIGIHCGPITAGVIGNARMQYDVWGDTVNVASRMESSSEPGRIHISEAIAKALNEALEKSLNESLQFRLAKRGEIEVKGKGLMKTYWLE